MTGHAGEGVEQVYTCAHGEVMAKRLVSGTWLLRSACWRCNTIPTQAPDFGSNEESTT